MSALQDTVACNEHYTQAVLSGGWFIMCNTVIDQSMPNY